jgi:hypothetical protein
MRPKSFYDKDEKVVRGFGIARDITERKRMEKTLGENLVHFSKKNRHEKIN